MKQNKIKDLKIGDEILCVGTSYDYDLTQYDGYGYEDKIVYKIKVVDIKKTKVTLV